MLSSKIVAPVSGHLVPITLVPDPVFAQKMVGDGVAIDPTSQVLLAPIAGTVVQLHSAHHALTLQSDSGIQVLMHIGLDTVQLKGEGFTPKVKVGDKVSVGQPLIEFSADVIARKAKSLLTLVVVVSGQSIVNRSEESLVEATTDILFEVKDSKGAGSSATKVSATAESKPIPIHLPAGLHARPAAQIVSLAKSFDSKIEIVRSGNAANAKSVVAILGLEIANGDQVTFRAEGTDAEKAVGAMAELLGGMEEAAEIHAPTPTAASLNERTGDPNKILFGIGVSPGLALGRIQQMRTTQFAIVESAPGNSAQEKAHLNQALRQANLELQDLHAKVAGKADNSRAAIFAAHQELLEDPDILQQVLGLIENGKSAAFAWDKTIKEHAERLANLNNELMAGRANDLRDVGTRVLHHLAEVADPAQSAPVNHRDVILSAENLTPSETVQIDSEKVVGFCTTTGGATSHVAILARSLGLPAIAGIDRRVLQLPDSMEVILDGDQGEIRINPSAADKAAVKQMQIAQAEKRKAALEKAHAPALTSDGRRIEVAANIGSVADAEKAVEMGADGVGLLRSEFLFLERATAPTEDEQYQIYQNIADALGARPLIIRTLDVGGDKPLQYLPLEPEENPFLGLRGIRIGLRHPEILRTQLRAILRVKSKGKIHVMFPMIATLEEFRTARAILEEERAKLKAPAIAVGIMVEVPSVALTADTFAREVDFFSIGTNDLTQYTLAMDRGHKDLAKQADAMHPSVLKLIELTCNAARKYGKWVGVCGGLAGDLKAVPILIGLGVEELSVSIPSIPLVKARVRETGNDSTTTAQSEVTHVRH